MNPKDWTQTYITRYEYLTGRFGQAAPLQYDLSENDLSDNENNNENKLKLNPILRVFYASLEEVTEIKEGERIQMDGYIYEIIKMAPTLDGDAFIATRLLGIEGAAKAYKILPERGRMCPKCGSNDLYGSEIFWNGEFMRQCNACLNHWLESIPTIIKDKPTIRRFLDL